MKLNHFEKLLCFVLDSQSSEEARSIVLILPIAFLCHQPTVKTLTQFGGKLLAQYWRHWVFDLSPLTMNLMKQSPKHLEYRLTLNPCFARFFFFFHVDMI